MVHKCLGQFYGRRCYHWTMPPLRSLFGPSYYVFIVGSLPEILEDVCVCGYKTEHVVSAWLSTSRLWASCSRIVECHISEEVYRMWWTVTLASMVPRSKPHWGRLKENVLSDSLVCLEDIVAHVHAAVTLENNDMMCHVREPLIQQANLCINMGGRTF